MFCINDCYIWLWPYQNWFRTGVSCENMSKSPLTQARFFFYLVFLCVNGGSIGVTNGTEHFESQALPDVL